MAIDMISYAIGAKNGSGGGGGGNSGLVVNAVYDEQTFETTLDKTWLEIKNAVASGNAVYVYLFGDEYNYGYQPVQEVCLSDGSDYIVRTFSNDYYTTSPDSYPYTGGK